MTKILPNEVESIISRLNFYDYDNFNSYQQKDLLINFKDKASLVRFGDINNLQSMCSYREQSFTIMYAIQQILSLCDDSTVILTKYSNKWSRTASLAYEFNLILKKTCIPNGFCGGIQLPKSDIAMGYVCESIFNYNSFVRIICPKSNLIIAPTDHFDVFVSAGNIEKQETLIKKILSSSPVLSTLNLISVNNKFENN